MGERWWKNPWVRWPALGVGLGALLVLATTAFALSPWGNDIIRKQVVDGFDAALAGSIEIEGLELDLHRVALQKAVLRDPQGAEVAAVDELEVGFYPWALLRNTVDVDRVVLRRPRLHLVSDAQGSNLARALAPTAPPEPEAPSPPAAPEPWTFVLGKLQVEGASVRLEDTSVEDGPPPLLIEELSLAGRVRAETTPGKGAHPGAVALDGDLEAKALLSRFERLPVHLRVAARPARNTLAPAKAGPGSARTGARTAVQVKIAAGATTVELQATVDPSAPRPEATIHLEKLELFPQTLRALTGGSPLVSPLAATGRVEIFHPKVRLQLSSQGSGGQFSLTAAANIENPALESLRLEGQGINLAHLIAKAPPSDFDLELSASARGIRPEDVMGKIELAVPAGRISDAQIGPVALSASLDRGRMALESLLVEAPGLHLEARGEVSQTSLALSGKLRAQDLARTARALLGQPAAEELGLRGRGALSFQLGGSPQAPAVDLRGGFARLEAHGHRLADLSLRLRSPNVLRPTQSHAEVSIGRLTTPRFEARAVGLRFSAPGARAFALELRATGDLAGRIIARGRWIVPGQSFFLDGLDLRARGLALGLARPARFELGGGPLRPLRIEGLDLRGSGQQLATDLVLGPDQSLKARAKVVLDLALLPKALLPEDLGLAGHLALELESAGQLPLPPSTARVRLRGGRFYDLEEVSLDLDASLRRQRISGQLEVAALGSGASASFALPVTWPWPANAPVAFTLATKSVDLAQLRRLLGKEAAGLPPATGRLSATVALEGKGRRPSVDVRAAFEDLVVDGQALGAVTLEVVDRGPGGPGPLEDPALTGLGIVVAAPDLGGGARLEVQTPYRAFELLTNPAALRPETLLRRPVLVKADCKRLPLSTLSRLARQAPISGHGSLTVDLTGPPRALLGAAALKLEGVTTAKIPKTDLTLGVALDERAVELDGTVVQVSPGSGSSPQPARPLLTLTAQATLPAEARLDPSRWLDAPLRVDAQLGPVRLRRDEPVLSPKAPLLAQVGGAIRVRGTPRRPELEVGAYARELALGDKRLGEAKLHASYVAAKPEVDLTIDGQAGGALTLHASALEPLPISTLLAPGFSPARLPLTIELSSKKLAMEVFSGLVPSVREIGGQLDGEVSFKGSLDEPRFSGRLRLSNGKATVSEVGRFEGITFDIAATEKGLALHELVVESGDGKARISGKADRTAAEGLALRLKAEVDRFPISSAGTRLGTATMRLRAQGQVDGQGMRITPLAIDQARIELEGTSPKEVQALERPEDIVYIRDGRPLDADEAERLAKRRQALGLDPAPLDEDGKPRRRRRTSFPIRVEIQAPRNLWVRGADANVELGLSDDFRVTVEERAEVFGNVGVRRGMVKVFGRRFDVARDSTVRFEGPPERPRLDTRIDHFNDRQNVKVWITAKGMVGELDIGFHSNPIYSQSEILTLLVTGRLDLSKRSTTETRDQAASLVGGFLASELQKSVLANVPLDVLTIGPDAIEAGTYLTDDLYLGYVRNLEAAPQQRRENVNAVHLEYEISPRWSLEGEYGDANKGSADLIWKIDY